jgi:type 1 glutamine amidotransferase
LEPYAAEPVIQEHKLPAARKRSEFERLIPAKLTPHDHGADAQAAPKAAEVLKPLHVVLCAAPKDPGHNYPGLHDYPIWRERWSNLVSLAENVTVETADRWPSADQWKRADLIMFCSDNPGWSEEKSGDLDTFLARGGGLMFLHWAVNGGKDADVFAQRIGLAWGAGARFRHGAEELSIRPHDITSGFPEKLNFVDETYWNLRPSGNVTVLASSVEDGAPRPQVWIREQDKGRVFCSILGHFTWTFDDPLYRVLLLRGMAWSTRQPLDRFGELVTVGARIQD